MATDLLALTYPDATFLALLLNRAPTNWGDTMRDVRAIKAASRMDLLIWQDERDAEVRAIIQGHRIKGTTRTA